MLSSTRTAGGDTGCDPRIGPSRVPEPDSHILPERWRAFDEAPYARGRLRRHDVRLLRRWRSLADDPITAKLQAPVAEKTKFIAGGAIFTCEGDTCGVGSVLAHLRRGDL